AARRAREPSSPALIRARDAGGGRTRNRASAVCSRVVESSRSRSSRAALPDSSRCNASKLMDYFPIFLKLTDEPVVVVGGGHVAARKIALLIRAGARITVVAPELVPELELARTEGRIVHIQAEFAPEHLEGARLAIAATQRRAVNAWVARQAE